MSQVQAVLIRKHPDFYLSKSQALSYVRSLGFEPIKKVHETPYFYRFRLQDPEKFSRFITLKRNRLVDYVIGFY